MSIWSVDFVNTPPDCSAVAASRTTLWPPNHQFHTVALSGATDADGPATLDVTGVTQDETAGAARMQPTQPAPSSSAN